MDLLRIVLVSMVAAREVETSATKTTQAFRGYLFQPMVIARLFPSGLSPQDFEKILIEAKVSMTENVTAALTGCVTSEQFLGLAYPKLDPL